MNYYKKYKKEQRQEFLSDLWYAFKFVLTAVGGLALMWLWLVALGLLQ